MNNDNLNSVGALILAAGFSDRMGTPKPFLPYDNNVIFIEKIIQSYIEFGCSKVVITYDENIEQWKGMIESFDNNDSVVFALNLHPEYERFYSVKIGLSIMNDIDFCFLQNADNPFITRTVLSTVYSRRKIDAFVVPTYNGQGGHPILLGNDVIDNILEVDGYNKNLKDILLLKRRINCDVNDASVLVNINSPDDYKKYFGKNYD